MKIIEKSLTSKEFDEYCSNRSCELEGNTYFGQYDEELAFSGGVKIKRIYSDETDDIIEILYDFEYNEETGEITYIIYEND